MLIAQYNHKYGIIQFKKWPLNVDSHSEHPSLEGIWYNHPALVAVWRVKSKCGQLSQCPLKY